MWWLIGTIIQLVKFLYKLLMEQPSKFLGVYIFMLLVNSSVFGGIDLMSILLLVGLVIWSVIFEVKKSRKEKEIAGQDKKITNPKPSVKIIGSHLSRHGFIFGKYESTTIIKAEDKDGHILIVGGVGSGKSSCIAIPSLLAWNERVFAIDIKGELYDKTKDKRPNIKVFNPQDDNTYGYDPYVFLRKSKNPAQEARAIAQAVIPLSPEIKEPFWIESAQTILTGAILHYYEDLSFIDTLKEIQQNNPQNLIEIISQSENEKARLCANSFNGMGENPLAGIFTELSRGIITLVTDDEIVSALSREKRITPEDLEFGFDIYINIPEHLLEQWKNLLSLIVRQFLKHFERRLDMESTPILFLLDEFARLGKIEGITNALATLRSKKITICLILQSLSQLDLIYGEKAREVICDTCSYQAVLNVMDIKTQENFSKLVGTYEPIIITNSENFDVFNLGLGKGISRKPEEKRIVKPHEFATLPDIVLLSPYGFLRVEKDPYYNQIEIENRFTDSTREELEKELKRQKRNSKKYNDKINVIEIVNSKRWKMCVWVVLYIPCLVIYMLPIIALAYLLDYIFPNLDSAIKRNSIYYVISYIIIFVPPIFLDRFLTRKFANWCIRQYESYVNSFQKIKEIEYMLSVIE